MKNQDLNKLEEKMVELFGKETSFNVSSRRNPNNTYTMIIEVVGLPFSIYASGKTYEESKTNALDAFFPQLEVALEDNLFPTMSSDCYEEISLTDDQLNRIIGKKETDDEVENEDRNDIKARVGRTTEGLYECVIESSAYDTHARGVGKTQKIAIIKAVWTARDIRNPTTFYIGDMWWEIN